MREGAIRIFTDGACSGNPGPGGWGAIVMTPDGRVRELGGGEPATTNNRMELLAAIAALGQVEAIDAPVELFTDSTYVIHGITRWVHGWKRNGWERSGGGAVLNRDLWEALHRLDTARRRRGGIAWTYVRGHAGTPGNERVDRIAVAFSQGEPVELYDGPLADYGVDVSEAHAVASDDDRSGGAKPAAKGAPVYLSLIDGVLERHATWKECEARVKGKANARFRKATSPAEESAILKSWGVSS